MTQSEWAEEVSNKGRNRAISHTGVCAAAICNTSSRKIFLNRLSTHGV